MAEKIQSVLKDIGSKLDKPPANKNALIKLLKQAAVSLSELEQAPSKATLEYIQPLINAIVKPELLKHNDKEVKLLVATCTCEITRVTAPEAPYNDETFKDIFHLIVSTFSGLRDTKGPSFGRRVNILESVAIWRSFIVMLDLECYDLINEMFRTFFAVASDDHSDNVIGSMKTIMIILLEESDEINEDLLLIILSVLGRNKEGINMSARKLAMNVIGQCSGKLEPGIKQFIVKSMSGEASSSTSQIDYHEVIYDVYRCAPQALTGIVPYLSGELMTDRIDVRLKAVKLVGDLFSIQGSSIPDTFQPIFLEFLKRLTDRVVEVRMSVLEHAKLCMLSDSFKSEAPQLISALCDRLLDYEESIHQKEVAVVSDLACDELSSILPGTIKLVADCLSDKSEYTEANTDITVSRKRGRPFEVKRQAKFPETPLAVSNENGVATPAAVDASKQKNTSATVVVNGDKTLNRDSGIELALQQDAYMTVNEKRGKRRNISSLETEAPAQDSSEQRANGDLMENSSRQNSELHAETISDDQHLSRCYLSRCFEGIYSSATVDNTVSGKKQSANSNSSLAVANGDVKTLPFEKQISCWRAIESMEVFRIIPQNPHFRPLNNLKQSAREEQAINKMIKFSCVADYISRLRPTNPKSDIEDHLKSLSELETHGFDVKKLANRLTDLLSLKNKHDTAETKFKTIKVSIEKKHAGGQIFEEELGVIDKQMSELLAKRDSVLSKKMKIDSYVAELEAEHKENQEALYEIGRQFDELAATPF